MTRAVRNPDVPLHGPWAQVVRWLEGVPVSGMSEADISWSPVLSEQSFDPGDGELQELWATGGWVSWLGGPAVPGAAWPRRGDGRPLAHVVTLSLADVDATLDAQGKAGWPGLREGLPTSGFLEVFHDLETYGHERGDDDGGAWKLRWTPDTHSQVWGGPDRDPLVDPPPDDVAPTAACQPVLPLPGFTLPFADHLHGRDGDQVTTMAEDLYRMWRWQRTGEQADHHPSPFSHVYGHSSTGTANALQVLRAVRPLAGPDDEHRLVLELESWTTLDGWFGDAHPLEVWMRDSDLAARDFSAAWCLVRTG